MCNSLTFRSACERLLPDMSRRTPSESKETIVLRPNPEGFL